VTITICTYIMVKLQLFINAFGYSRLWLLVRRWESFFYKIIFMERNSMLIDIKMTWQTLQCFKYKHCRPNKCYFKSMHKTYTRSLPWSQVQMIMNKTNLHPNPCWMNILRPSFLWWDTWQLCNCCLWKVGRQLNLGC